MVRLVVVAFSAHAVRTWVVQPRFRHTRQGDNAFVGMSLYVGLLLVFAGSPGGTGTDGKFTGVGPLVTGAAVGRTAVPSSIWVVLGTGTSGMMLFSFLRNTFEAEVLLSSAKPRRI